MKYYNMYMDRQVISQGKHRELLESCPIYREIYASQTGGEQV